MTMRKRLTALLLTGLLLLTAGCAQQAPASEEGFAENAEAFYDFGTVQIGLPVEYLDLLIVETGGDDCEEDRPLYPRDLMQVYEKASVEAAEADYGEGAGFGFLWGFWELDQAALEELLDTDPSGISVFARKGDLYYAFVFPTDVQFYRSGDFSAVTEQDWQHWEALNELGNQVREDFMVRNELTLYSAQGIS